MKIFLNKFTYMNYKLELNKQEANPNLIFNNIIFDFFKINIVERYSKPIKSNSSADFIIFKVRTLNNEIIKLKNDISKFTDNGKPVCEKIEEVKPKVKSKVKTK